MTIQNKIQQYSTHTTLLLLFLSYYCNGYIFTTQNKITPLPNRITTPNTRHAFLTMKVSSGKGKAKTSHYKGSSVAMLNYQRIQSAGRKGSKRFVDPCKIFLGNLSFQATESDIETFFVTTNGIPREHIVSYKIIREWKTQQSKGFGFIQFRDPIYATSALECVKGKRINGRIVRLSQGQKKLPDPIFLMKKKKVVEVEEEEFDISLLSSGEEEEEEDDEEEIEIDGLYKDEYLLDDELNISTTTREERTATTRKERREWKVKYLKSLKKSAVGFGGASSSTNTVEM